jgi:hypothetical protein
MGRHVRSASLAPRSPEARVAAGLANRAVAVESVSLDHLLAAKKLADQLGGVEVARQAMASYVRLMR